MHDKTGVKIVELKKSVFVIMSFNDQESESAYLEVVRPICEASGMDVIRADEINSNQVIYDDILQGIRRADIVIADISGKNPNVMYELGIAHSIKQQSTIMLTHDEFTEAPFDIKHFRIISYTDSIIGTNKLKSELTNTIALLLDNYELTSRNEFEFCFECFKSFGKINDLIGYHGLLKSSPEQLLYDNSFHWYGTSGKNAPKGGSNFSLRTFLKPFEDLQMIIVNETIEFTSKGKAFAKFLEDKGVECVEAMFIPSPRPPYNFASMQQFDEKIVKYLTSFSQEK